jgi:hypothetical protein
MSAGPIVDVMLDIETLAARPGAVVLSAAFVLFSDLTGPTWRLRIADQIILGMAVDSDTQAWWGRQSADAWQAATDDQRPLRAALRDIAEWIGGVRSKNALRLWCNGANFDAPVMEEVYRRAGIACPWTYREVSCARTLYKLAGVNVRDFAEGIAHSAYDDAVAQAKAAAAALQKLSAAPA